MHIQLFRETFSEKEYATIPKGIIVDGFLVHCSSKKFEKMAREAMDVRLRVVNESNKTGAPNEIIVQNHLEIALLNVL